MEENKLLLAWYAWNRYESPEDFEVLYRALFPIVEKYIERFPEEIKDTIKIHALATFFWALKRWNSKGQMTLQVWIATSIRKVSRKAGKMLYPGVPESRWHRLKWVGEPKADVEPVQEKAQ